MTDFTVLSDWSQKQIKKCNFSFLLHAFQDRAERCQGNTESKFQTSFQYTHHAV